MSLFARIAVRTLGTIAILFGVAMALVLVAGVPGIEPDERPWALVALSWVPLGLGQLLFAYADELRERRPLRTSRYTRVLRLGLALALFGLWTLGATLSIEGRLVLAFLLFVVFARVHHGWSSRSVRLRRIGWVSFADAFDALVGGIVFLFTTALVALLTGGRVVGGWWPGAGSSRSGGTFGGGGASGRW